ncbi:Protein CONSERVED IN THE GREEN LINEAGE AND DIATOMS 27 chloroplastic [Bienertia sinuspersici]
MAKILFLSQNPSISPPTLFLFSTPFPTISLLPLSIPLNSSKRYLFSSNLLKNHSISTSPIPSSSSGLDCPVPLDQQPINEYQNLSTSFPFSWASGDVVEYFSRLMATGLSFGILVGLPVSWFGSGYDPVKLVLGSVSSGLFMVTLAVLRMYLGWAYVGNRLLSATVEYEETGWYDGQIWVKTAEVLARDRLLGSFQVKPILSRLKNSLIALAISLFISVALLINYEGSQKELRKLSNEAGDRVVAGVYNDDSARLFEPDAFHDEPGLLPE